MEGLWCEGPSVHPSDVLFLARLIHAIIVMREGRLFRLFRLFVCGSPSSPQSVSQSALFGHSIERRTGPNSRMGRPRRHVMLHGQLELRPGWHQNHDNLLMLLQGAPCGHGLDLVEVVKLWAPPQCRFQILKCSSLFHVNIIDSMTTWTTL